jgi:DNA-binding LytR/AlgR family response regulator
MKKYFFIRQSGATVRLKFEEVMYIEAVKNYCKIYTETKHYLVLSTMKQLQDFFPEDEFIRIHKSYIVSANRRGYFN